MNSPYQDCYFFDAALALEIARQQNRVPRTIAVTGLQICYLGSDRPLPDAPPNLIQVPPRETIGFFTNTRLRLPKKIVLAADLPPQIANRQLNSFKQMLRTVEQKRLELTRIYAEQIVRQCPVFETGKPLRIFIAASRLTTVMQYASRDLANAFRALGHEVLFMIEENDMEEFEPAVVLQAQLKFNPHLVVNINHRANGWLHPEVFNLCWWQDLMPEIREAKPLRWRDRDLIYSYTKSLDELLYKTGAPQVERQGFCIDTDLFCPNPRIKREEKVVFIGSGFPASQGPQTPGQKQAFTEICQRLEKGEALDEERCNRIAAAWGIDPHYTYWKLFYFAVRRNTVRWLCQQKRVPVEIYGRYWDEDEIVRPFYQGEVPHGKAVADIYNSARYALVNHPFEVQSQRLAEAAACGCVPLVYDSRHNAEPPHWDDYCLFFSSRESLEDAFSRRAADGSQALRNFYSIKNFTQRILDKMDAIIGHSDARYKYEMS